MKVLLINPPTKHMVKSRINSFGDNLLVGSPLPPLGLMYLASHIEKLGHEVKILDLVTIPHDYKMAVVSSDIIIHKPDLVGITTTTLTLYDALEVAKEVKSVGKIPVVIGGAHCNIYPEETAKLNYIDYVIRGDGWLPFEKLLNGGQFFKVSEVEPLLDFDSVPFPARYLTDITKYHSIMTKGKLATTMVSSLGCPMSCTFCHQPHYKKWRARSAENVVQEMTDIVNMGITEIEIYDDTFTYDKDRVLQICDLILSKNLKVDWNIRTRVDRVDLELLKLMSKAGCKRVNYGIESVSPNVLKALRKGFTMEQTKNAIKWTKQAGIGVQSYFMIGSPTETKEQILDTIHFANKYIDDYAFYTITSLMPGTPMYEQGLKDGKYKDFWKEFVNNPTPDFTSRFWDEDNRDELNNLLNYGYRSFYGRPIYVLRQILKVRSFQELWRKAMMAFRMFILTGKREIDNERK